MVNYPEPLTILDSGDCQTTDETPRWMLISDADLDPKEPPTIEELRKRANTVRAARRFAKEVHVAKKDEPPDAEEDQD